MFSRPRIVTCLALFSLHLSGCLLFAGRHWEVTRRSVINPINATLHRHYPASFEAAELDGVVAYYATDSGDGLRWSSQRNVVDSFSEERILWEGKHGEESIRDRYAKTLALFERIDRAELRIHYIDWSHDDDLGFPAQVRLLLRGQSPEGRQQVFDQRSDIRVLKKDNSWLISAETVKSRELISSSSSQFQAITKQAGLNIPHDISESPKFRLIGDVGASSGSAVADFNCDGLEDIALLSTNQLHLLGNDANGSFSDRRFDMGIDGILGISATGLVFFDADNDGDPDLWISGVTGQVFLRNDDCERFVDTTDAVGIESSVWSSMPAVADFDRDGFLDVYVVRMGNHQGTAPEPNWDARNGHLDSLYHNNGDGTFHDVAKDAGIQERGWGLTAAWGDFNNDSFPDLYVGNEFGYNALYRNNGDGSFTDIAIAAGARDRGAAMGITWGDYDNDGDLDIYVSNMYANSRWAMFHPEFPPPLPWYLSWVPRSDIETVIDELTRGSTLLRNNGDETFTDVSQEAGVRDAQWGWSAEFLDFNNDALLDIYAVNGFVTGPLEADV